MPSADPDKSTPEKSGSAATKPSASAITAPCATLNDLTTQRCGSA
jgi:hypothetical protein